MPIAEPVEIVHPYVESNPKIQGGRPVIKGTRFPVNSIVQNHQRGLIVDEILLEFPHLSSAAVYDALSFYYDHREQIDQEIAKLRDVSQAVKEFPPTRRPPNDAS